MKLLGIGPVLPILCVLGKAAAKATALIYKAPPPAKCQLAAMSPTHPAQGVKASPPPPPPSGAQAPEPVPKPPPAQWLATPSRDSRPAPPPPHPPTEARPRPKPKPPPPPCASEDEDADDAASVTPPATPTADAGKQETGFNLGHVRVYGTPIKCCAAESGGVRCVQVSYVCSKLQEVQDPQIHLDLCIQHPKKSRREAPRCLLTEPPGFQRVIGPFDS